ncbi:T9SS type A sorting domain-containing protein [Rhodocaloribacter litoris]|uniref:T9SS type A sorting domain-containing protein n=1 Tax=Rhodocaloribacter litoris TaxID=2558931 RepID=UPI00142363BF|nr:T9SS type A sorting domain-containing protein [Rhodocaloribacter litoris]QXD14090.1 T9SS type A sorting domain-containing protein [Rhodocaloribacter litoris]
MRLVLFFSLGVILLGAAPEATAQLRQYEVHRRGMLHETIYNTGEIGRAYHQGQAGNDTNVPLMEWPGYSATVVDDISFDGKHYIIGGGMNISGEAADTTQRMFAFAGGVGSSTPEQVAGRWVFPYGVFRTENYPVLDNGELNPDYNPDEAEEIIVSTWGTSLGVLVTRTTRAWSYPDYDDFIIYEYELEYTGDRDGDLIPDTEAPLTDVLVSFVYGFAGNMFGYQREYNRWLYTDYERNDQRARFDPTRWLAYNLHMNGLPDPVYRDAWGASGENGGGLNAPGAPGFMMLYYDMEHLATPDETHADVAVEDSAIVWTTQYGGGPKIIQPWMVRLETSNLRQSKIEQQLVVDPRKNPPYRGGSVEPPAGDTTSAIYRWYQEYWVGRGRFNHRQTRKAVGRFFTFGPYTLRIGDRLRFAYAEVIGYGAATREETEAGLVDFGGSCGEDCGEASERAFYPVPNYAEVIRYGGTAFPPTYPYGFQYEYGNTYLSEYGLPDYVNSDVVTVRDVADKAKEAYTGSAEGPPYAIESFPPTGVYRLPIPVPAPAIEVASDERAQNVIFWGPQVESFEHERLQGRLDHYAVYRARHPVGPWQLLARVTPGDPDFINNGDISFVPEGYYFVRDPEPRVGETYYYSVLSVDEAGRTSGRTNLTRYETQLGPADELREVYVVPNPFVVRSGFGGAVESQLRLGFYGLPARATIKIYSFAGQLVETIEHDDPTYSTAYLQVTRNNQRLASGVYFYVVTTPSGEMARGKFAIIR